MIRRAAALAALSLSSLLACGETTESAAPKTAVTAPPPATASATTPREVLPFLHDDYPRALAEAKAAGRPIFVDAWAPWCHSCLSMRSYVLNDPSLAPLANDFVWLSIDTEKDENAAFVSKFGNKVWPTLWVIDPAAESTTLKYEGTATAPELIALLRTTRAGGGETAAQFLTANRAAARGDQNAAEQGYRAVLAAKDAPDHARAAEALAGLLSGRKEYAGCTDLAITETPRLPSGTSRATVLVIGLECAVQAKRDADARVLMTAAERAAADPDPHTLADDRSALYEGLVEAKQELHDDAGAKATAQAWATYLEGEAARAPNSEARAVFDPHRLNAYLAAGQPARAVPMLQQSEREHPSDYNPPARLAKAYLEMKQLDDAQAAVQRAAAKVYGPRSLRVFALAADIAKARGDATGERAALQQGLARTSKSVLSESQKKLRAELEKRLRELPGGAQAVRG